MWPRMTHSIYSEQQKSGGQLGVWVKAFGPVVNTESSEVHKRSAKTKNLSPNYKFQGLSLSTTILVRG